MHGTIYTDVLQQGGSGHALQIFMAAAKQQLLNITVQPQEPSNCVVQPEAVSHNKKPDLTDQKNIVIKG